MTWICTNCTTRYEKKEPPCTECGGEKFAKIESDGEGQIESAIQLEWRCEECGEPHVKNAPPCNQCGHMQFESVQISSQDTAAAETQQTIQEEGVDPTEHEFNWLRPNGPFKGLRKWVWRVTWVSFVGLFGLGVLAPAWGGSGWRLFAVYLILGLPELVAIYGVLWFVDIVLAYLKQ